MAHHRRDSRQPGREARVTWSPADGRYDRRPNQDSESASATHNRHYLDQQGRPPHTMQSGRAQSRQVYPRQSQGPEYPQRYTRGRLDRNGRRLPSDNFYSIRAEALAEAHRRRPEADFLTRESSSFTRESSADRGAGATRETRHNRLDRTSNSAGHRARRASQGPQPTRAPRSRQGTWRRTKAQPTRVSPTLPGGRILGLDGLRAIAILSVLLFHLDPDLLPGGFMGVDVFFVVSGFLITTLLIRERHKTGHSNLANFWIRRARRLIPALVSLIIIVVPLTWLCTRWAEQAQDLLVRISPQIIGVLTFSYNWVEIAAGSSYFTRNVPQLFMNFWSLAVEEQFYLLWPWVFVWIARRHFARRRVSFSLLIVAAASAVGMAVLFSPDLSTRVYYGTDTHLLGLMIGAALAFEASRADGGFITTRFWSAVGPVLGWLSCAGLIVLMIIIGDGSAEAFHGGIAVANVLTAIMIASFLVKRGGLVPLMSSGPASWVGNRSYAVYLWHWPLIILAQIVIPTPDNSAASWAVRLGAVVVTFIVCEISLRYLETPIRRLGFRGAWAAFCGLFVKRPDTQSGDGRRTSARRNPHTSRRVRLTPAAVATLIVPVALAACTVSVASTAPDKTLVEQKITENEHLVNTGDGSSPGDGAGATGGQGIDRSDTVDYTPPEGKDTTMFGDSMLVTAAPEIVKDYPGVDIVAQSERAWEQAIPIMQDMERKGKIRRAVVIALGTNWGVRDPQAVEQEIDEIQRGRTVVLVNTYGAGWEPQVTDEYQKIAAKYPNVTVADWSDVAAKHTGDLQSDGIHPDYGAMPIFVDCIKQAFSTLAQNKK
ncbi:acyltransferase family protein [Corynebacterium kroppenstedtii]|uniref:Lipopolysaccharide modification acyltransferase n=1 Tax=Corynebacterium kroppenstedtii TaxID=161879 RepID=A0A2W5SYX5_9CORY|nr:acyltransferase family protein [Corynebacterium kroppenstedtii]PZR05853.1 MAG: lipopolysaccharide modification acyltransferase [Corynebacterium kroppenstedtii]